MIRGLSRPRQRYGLIGSSCPRPVFDGGHECETVRDAGFIGKENGELLALAEGYFDVLVTIDRRPAPVRAALACSQRCSNRCCSGRRTRPSPKRSAAKGAPVLKPRSSRNCFGTVSCPFSPIFVVVRDSSVPSRLATNRSWWEYPATAILILTRQSNIEIVRLLLYKEMTRDVMSWAQHK